MRVSLAVLVVVPLLAAGAPPESFDCKNAHPLDAARLANLQKFIEDGQRSTQVPGIAVAVVQGGKVVFAKGFGVRALGSNESVTPDTLFRVASITKSLTSLMVSQLVAEKTLDWDTRVTALYPPFALGSAELTQKLTLRHTLCACTGVAGDDLGMPFEYAGATGETLIGRMRSLVPTAPIGETIQESNPMIAAAGYVAAHAYAPKKPLDEAYVEVMREKVLQPLGMKSTTFDSTAAARAEHASPHLHENAAYAWEPAQDLTQWDAAMKPAIGAWSTANDLARVVQVELANGKTPDGKQVFAEKTLLERREPQVGSGDKSSYGLGMYLDRFSGLRVDGTAGHAPGYASNLFFIPDCGVGGVMLTNGDPPITLPSRFERKVIELLFDGRSEAAEALAADLKRERAAHAEEVGRYDLAPGRAFFEPYAGTYANPLYGQITIRLEGNGALLDAGEWKTLLGRKREKDGTVKLAAVPPPWLGWPAFTRRADGALEATINRKSVVFERKKPR